MSNAGFADWGEAARALEVDYADQQRLAENRQAQQGISPVLLKEFVEMSKLKRDLEKELDSVSARLKELEPTLLDQFSQNSTQSMKAYGHTVFIHRQLWAKAKDGNKEAVIEALREADLAQYISENYNTNSLSAYVREMEKTGQALPEALDATIEKSEVFSLRTRAS